MRSMHPGGGGRAEKVNLSLAPHEAAALRRRAAEERKPLARYVADLVKADAKRHRDELACAGYRELGAEMLQQAEENWRTAAEGWPAWEK